MRTAFTRETITAGRAKLFIHGAAFFATIRALFTLYFILKGLPGLTPWNFLDVALLVGIAIGIMCRNLPAAWTGLIYCGLNTALKLIRYPGTDPLHNVGELITYGMAIVCIGLYPRPRTTTTSRTPGAKDQGTDLQSGEAV